MPETRAIQDHQKGKSFKAFNIVFVVEATKGFPISVPAEYCGVNLYTRIKKMLLKGKKFSHHFNNDDKICPKNFKEVLFLGKKVKPGMLASYPEPYFEARFLTTGKKYSVTEVRLRHMN